MSIKIGKYKTVSGYLVEIVCRLPEPNNTQYKWFGYYYNTKWESYFVENWSDDGICSRNDERFDIVFPKIYKYKSLYINGGCSSWYDYCNLPHDCGKEYGTLRGEYENYEVMNYSTIEFAREGEIPESWTGE